MFWKSRGYGEGSIAIFKPVPDYTQVLNVNMTINRVYTRSLSQLNWRLSHFVTCKIHLPTKEVLTTKLEALTIGKYIEKYLQTILVSDTVFKSSRAHVVCIRVANGSFVYKV